MRLSELEPRWASSKWADGVGSSPSAWKFGVTFLCPCCQKVRLAVLFKPFIDPEHIAERMLWAVPGAPDPNTGEVREVLFWQRTGETFDDLTLTPSIDVSKYGHWHGHITNGEIQ